MTSDDVRDIFNQLQGMLHGVEQAKIVQEIVVAYDRFAESAMKKLIEMSEESNEMVETGDWNEAIAREAWVLADAMMAERAKRGLGSPPPYVPAPDFAAAKPNGEPKS